MSRQYQRPDGRRRSQHPPVKRISQIALETEHGLRTIELHSGDLTRMGFEVDVLCISSVRNHYAPEPGTVIESLQENVGLSVARLRENCELDLTRQFGIWVSHQLNDAPFRRIVCAEIAYTNEPERVIDKIGVAVAILDALNIEVRSLAMPLLFAGSLQMPAERMAALLVPVAERVLTRAHLLERVLFVDKEEARARALGAAFDTLLGRAHLVLSQKSLITGLKSDMLAAIAGGEAFVPEGHLRLVTEMRDALSAKKLRAVDLGILARRVVEFIANDLLGESQTSPDVFSRIDKLGGKGVANWIQSYMHVLRTLGNEAAHEKNTYGRRPPSVQEADLIICLLCLHRLWSFWTEWRRDTQPASARMG